jgi:hypothetical protein
MLFPRDSGASYFTFCLAFGWMLVKMSPLCCCVSRWGCCGAGGAEAAHIEHALQQPEAMVAGGLVAGLQHGPVLEFLGAAAAHADEVVVAVLGIAG